MKQRQAIANVSPTQQFYMFLISAGVVVSVKDGQLVISEGVSPMLQRMIERRKTDLVKHIEGLPK